MVQNLGRLDVRLAPGSISHPGTERECGRLWLGPDWRAEGAADVDNVPVRVDDGRNSRTLSLSPECLISGYVQQDDPGGGEIIGSK